MSWAELSWAELSWFDHISPIASCFKCAAVLFGMFFFFYLCRPTLQPNLI